MAWRFEGERITLVVWTDGEVQALLNGKVIGKWSVSDDVIETLLHSV